MKSKLLDSSPERTWALIMDNGDEAASSIAAFAHEQGLNGSHFTAIGEFSCATLGTPEKVRSGIAAGADFSLRTQMRLTASSPAEPQLPPPDPDPVFPPSEPEPDVPMEPDVDIPFEPPWQMVGELRA